MPYYRVYYTGVFGELSRTVTTYAEDLEEARAIAATNAVPGHTVWSITPLTGDAVPVRESTGLLDVEPAIRIRVPRANLMQISRRYAYRQETEFINAPQPAAAYIATMAQPAQPIAVSIVSPASQILKGTDMRLKHDPYYDAYLEMISRRASEDRRDSWKPKLDYRNRSAVAKHNHLTRLLAYTSGEVEGVRTFRTVPCHPTILAALEVFGSPKDWHLLALEQPQVSSDGRRVAYVRNEDKRQAHYESDDPTNPYLTATTPSKYITRHWPHVRSDKIRDLCEAQTHKFAFADDLEEMIEIVIDGTSYSCMQNFRPESHPYQVYDPKFGWKLAYAEQDGRLVARALVNDEYKCFVRTYGKENGQGDTQSHPGLHHFLVSQGYNYLTAWPEGCQFAKLKEGGEWLAPFLDPGSDRIQSPNSRRVTDAGDCFERSDSGEFIWDNTDGTATSPHTCDECGEPVDEDDCTWVGERRLCEGCLCDGYVSALTTRGESEYIPNAEAVCVDGEYYHPDHLDRHDIVQLETGHYAHIGNTAYVEDEGYYHDDDVADKPSHPGCVVLVGRDYRLRSECVWCEYGDKWLDQDDAIQVPDGYIEQGYFDVYILQLERDDVIKACEFREEAVDMCLAIWDAHYAANEAQAALV